MSLREFRDMLLVADPLASHYVSTQQPDYTVWSEYGDRVVGGEVLRDDAVLKIQIDRYTTIEYDPIVDAIKTALTTAGVAFDYLVDTEEDENGKLRYIHHIFDCEVV